MGQTPYIYNANSKELLSFISEKIKTKKIKKDVLRKEHKLSVAFTAAIFSPALSNCHYLLSDLEALAPLCAVGLQDMILMTLGVVEVPSIKKTKVSKKATSVDKCEEPCECEEPCDDCACDTSVSAESKDNG
jgi:hypothetical protein